MLGKKLLAQTQIYAKGIIETSPVFQKTRLGQLDKKTVGLYLYNMNYLFSHALKNHHTALYCAKDLPSNVGEFFKELIELQKDHEFWAVNDLAQFDLERSTLLKYKILPAVGLLTAHLHEMATLRPYSYIGHHFFSSYMATNVGAAWLELLQLNCGISVSEISILAKYQAIDEEYPINAFYLVDELIPTFEMNQVMEDVHTGHRLLDQFFLEITEFNL